jgi:hypothetical protein
MKKSAFLLLSAMVGLVCGCQAGTQFTGAVRDRVTRQPIAGVTVTLTRVISPDLRHDQPVAPPAELVTDRDGRFRFTLTPEQARNPNLLIGLDLKHPRYADTDGGEKPLSDILAALKRGERPWFDDLLMSPGEEISGIVEDPDGRPLAGCPIDYSPNGHGYADGKTMTDAAGRFRFNVAKGSTHNVMILRPANYAMSYQMLWGLRGDVGRLRLQPGTPVTGTVRDEQGRPVAGVYVIARALGFMSFNAEAGVKTDAQGRYALEPLKPGPYRLAVADGRFAPLGIGVRVGRPSETFDFRPADLVTLRFKVVDEQGKPARRTGAYPRCTVDACGYESGQWYNAASAPTDSNGIVTLRVPRGLEDANVGFCINEGRTLRWTNPMTGQPESGRRMKLGTLSADVPEITLTEAPDPPAVAAAFTSRPASPR